MMIGGWLAVIIACNDFFTLGLQITIDPILMISKHQRLDRIGNLMTGLLRKGEFETLLQVLDNPIYSFNHTYETITCPKLFPETIQATINSNLPVSSKAKLLNADCLLAGNVLQKLGPVYARTLPENVLVSDKFEIGKMSPAFLDELLNRAFIEKLKRKPVNFCNLFTTFSTDHYEAPFFKTYAWRTMSVSCFRYANFAAKTWLISQCGSKIARLEPSTPASVWIESMERLLTLVVFYRKLLSISYDRSNEHFALISNNLDYLFQYLDELQTPKNPNAAIVLRIMLNLCTFKHVDIRDFTKNVLPLLRTDLLTADWLFGVLTITIGSAEDTVKLAEFIVNRYNPHPILCSEMESFLRRSLHTTRNLCAKVSRNEERLENIKDLRAEFLPDGQLSRVVILPAIANVMTMPYERLYAAWIDLKRINYAHPDSFSEYYFGYLKNGAPRIFSDHRNFLWKILTDFLETPEMYLKSHDGDGIIPSTLCPPSLWEIIGTLLHQQFLLGEPATIVIDKTYFIAALKDDTYALSTLFSDISPGIAQLYYGLNGKDSVFSELYCTNCFQETVFSLLDTVIPVKNINFNTEDGERHGHLFGEAAKLFAKSLRQVFKAEYYPAEELYSLLSENRKIKSKNG